MDKICFIIDSMSTFDKQKYANQNIHILAYCVNDSNANLIYDDFSNEQKLKILDDIENKNNKYKTSFLSTSIIENTLDDLLTKYEKVIYLCASEGYTGQFQNAKLIMDNPKYKDKVYIFNTFSIASTIETILDEIRLKLNQDSNINYNEIQELIDDLDKRSIILFSPKNLIGMVNSGRVPLLLAKIMKLTKIHPVIKCEEKNKATGVVFRKWNEVAIKLCETAKKIFKSKISNETISRIYFYSSLLTPEEINDYIKVISTYFNIDPSLIELRITPLPIVIYTLKDSIGIGITLKPNHYKE